MKEERDHQLMQYLDGELASREARAVEERLAGSADERDKLEAMKQIGELVRARYAQAADEAAPRLDALWERIERRLDAPPRDAARADEAEGWLAAVRDFWDLYRGHVATAVIGAAAGALLAIAFDDDPVRVKVVHIRDPQISAPAAVSVEHAAIGEAAEVESLEIAGGTGTIFHIPGDGEDETATTVIWVTPEAEI